MTRASALLWFGLLILPCQAQPTQPDIEIDARVKMKSIRFDSKPQVDVTFPGHPERDTSWTTERKNIPPSITPGTTYRNVEVHTHIQSTFKELGDALWRRGHLQP